MTKKFIATLTVVTMLFTASSAKAQVSNTGWTSDGGASLDGFVVYDLTASFTGQYTGAQLIVELTAGSIYQDTAGGTTPPNQAVINAIPTLEWDTFVAQGSSVADGPSGNPSPGGGAVDLGGAAAAVFSNAAINQAWNPSGGQTGTSDQTDFLLTRLTLSNDALGTAQWLVSAAGTPLSLSLPIVDGKAIPEPTTMVLAAFGLIGVVASRRRS